MITSEAMIVSWMMMRMLDGIRSRIRLIDRFESAQTTVSAIDITTAVSSLLVTASAEQMPSTCTATGLVLSSGSNRISLLFLAIADLRRAQAPPLLVGGAGGPLSRTFCRNGPNPFSPSQNCIMLVTPRLVMVAPDSASTSYSPDAFLATVIAGTGSPGLKARLPFHEPFQLGLSTSPPSPGVSACL